MQEPAESAGKGNAAASLQHIVESLEEEIVLGRLQPRERLLEEELAKIYAAKRHVIRAALAELETMGIVVRQPNRGASVRDFTPEEVSQIYDVRELLERHAAEIMPLPPTPEVLEKLNALHAQHSEAAQANDPRTVFRANLAFHRELFAACGNPYLSDQINALASRAHAIRFHAITDAALLQRALDEHARMIELLERGDRENLVELVVNHLRPSKEAYLRLAASPWRRPFH